MGTFKENIEILAFQQKRTCIPKGLLPKFGVGVYGPLSKTPTQLKTKSRTFPYPIYDLTAKTIPCFRPAI